jgi:hypothetical protein
MPPVSKIVPSENAEIEQLWLAAMARIAAAERKIVNTFIMLIMQTLWLERNARVFERSSTTAQITLRLLLEE